MDGGLVGRVSSHEFTRFVFFIVMVLLAVDIGILLAGLLPQLPGNVRTLMAPTSAASSGSAHPQGVPAV